MIGSTTRFKIPDASLHALTAMTRNKDEDAYRKYLQDITYCLVPAAVRHVVVEARTAVGPVVMVDDLLCCKKFDITEQAHAITLPTLVICGSEDDKTPVEDAHVLANKIVGAREVIIDEGTHSVFLERPREVNEAIRKFLSSLR